MSVNCFTYFGWYLHPSSGTRIPVTTASGTNQTVTATCRCGECVGAGLSVLSEVHWSTDECTSDNSCSWWLVEVPPETCRAVYRHKETVCNYILMDSYWICTYDAWTHKYKKEWLNWHIYLGIYNKKIFHFYMFLWLRGIKSFHAFSKNFLLDNFMLFYCFALAHLLRLHNNCSGLHIPLLEFCNTILALDMLQKFLKSNLSHYLQFLLLNNISNLCCITSKFEFISSTPKRQRWLLKNSVSFITYIRHDELWVALRGVRTCFLVSLLCCELTLALCVVLL